MKQDIKETQTHHNLMTAYKNNLQSDQEPPPIEQKMIIICNMLSKYALPKDAEIFFTQLSGAWLAVQAKEEGIAPANKKH
ncbi:MAG: hypothetical protein QNL62_19630 [Gammaproteobacteria bacterium]|nr:hypothetical protein [Gammaproteobacteria bacterium]